MADENKKELIDDPLAGFGIVDDEQSEVFAEKEKKEKEPKEKKPSVLKEKYEELKEKASEPVENRKAGKIIAIIAAVALIAAVAVFVIYTNIPVRSGYTVEQWAQEWNAVSYSDMTAEENDGNFLLFDTMLSKTDMKLSEQDIKDLKAGRSVRVFDDMATLSVKTTGDDIASVDFQIDSFAFADKYGDETKYTSIEGAETLRQVIMAGHFINAGSAAVKEQMDAFSMARSLYNTCFYIEAYGDDLIADKVDENHHAFWSDGKFTYSLYRVAEIDADTIKSVTDLSDTDAIANGIKMKMNLSMKFILDGQKTHPANWNWDWSWLKNIFGSSSSSTAATTADNEPAAQMSDSDVVTVSLADKE